MSAELQEELAGAAPAGERPLSLRVNGREHRLRAAPSDLLLDVLHDDLGRSDVRYGCGEGVCGTCTVLLDGEPVSSCLLWALQAEGHEVTTLAGLSGEGGLHPLQVALLEGGGLQCGFCTPGVLLTAYSLTERVSRPGRDEIRHELVGNLCRCTGYSKIVDAVETYLDSRGAPSPGPAGGAGAGSAASGGEA